MKMKLKLSYIVLPTLAFVAIAVSLPSTPQAQGRGGMPAEARNTIHGLFNAHDQFERKVEATEEGYTAITTTKNPELVGLLQKHVRQMEQRMKQGLMVRRWDPAYEEFSQHYKDIDIQVRNLTNGVAVVAVGKTELARKIARNHAGIVSRFLEGGWDEHDKSHPAVEGNLDKATPEKGKSCCLSSKGADSPSGCCSEKGNCEKETGEPLKGLLNLPQSP